MSACGIARHSALVRVISGRSFLFITSVCSFVRRPSFHPYIHPYLSIRPSVCLPVYVSSIIVYGEVREQLPPLSPGIKLRLWVWQQPSFPSGPSYWSLWRALMVTSPQGLFSSLFFPCQEQRMLFTAEPSACPSQLLLEPVYRRLGSQTHGMEAPTPVLHHRCPWVLSTRV